MAKQQVTYAVKPFADVLGELISNDVLRDSIDAYRHDGAEVHPPGSHKSTVKQLFGQLFIRTYSNVVDRPHSDSELKRWLKNPELTAELHREHGLVLNVNGSCVEIHKVGWKPRP